MDVKREERVTNMTKSSSKAKIVSMEFTRCVCTRNGRINRNRTEGTINAIYALVRIECFKRGSCARTPVQQYNSSLKN